MERTHRAPTGLIVVAENIPYPADMPRAAARLRRATRRASPHDPQVGIRWDQS
jgi:hypothetical protein